MGWSHRRTKFVYKGEVLIIVVVSVVVIKKSEVHMHTSTPYVSCSKVVGQEGWEGWVGEAKKSKERGPGAHEPFVQV